MEFCEHPGDEWSFFVRLCVCLWAILELIGESRVEPAGCCRGLGLMEIFGGAPSERTTMRLGQGEGCMQPAQPDGSLSIIGKSEDRQKHTHDKELLVPATERTGGKDSSSI